MVVFWPEETLGQRKMILRENCVCLSVLGKCTSVWFMEEKSALSGLQALLEFPVSSSAKVSLCFQTGQ